MGAAAYAVIVLALFAGTAWATGAVVLTLWSWAVSRRQARARTAFAAAAVPWCAGILAGLAALLPGDPHTGAVLACHCVDVARAWLHLCPMHPEHAAAVVLPAAAVLGLVGPGRARATWALLAQPRGRGGAPQVQVLDLGTRMVVLHGWWRPSLVADASLWRQLDAQDRGAIVAHEAAHLRRRDPLLRFVLAALLVVSPRPLAASVAATWLDRAELAADAEAARRLRDPLAVALALVRCARLGAVAPATGLAWTTATVERRVKALLDAPTSTRPARPDLGLLDLVWFVVAAGAVLWVSPWVHHAVEHLLEGM